MLRLTIRFAVALLSFLIGVGAFAAWHLLGPESVRLSDVPAPNADVAPLSEDPEKRCERGSFEMDAFELFGGGQNSQGTNMIYGGLLKSAVISGSTFQGPPQGKADEAEGRVRVRVVVSESGKVTTAHAISGRPQSRLVAVRAACRSRLTPTTSAGRPVRVAGEIQYFVLQ